MEVHEIIAETYAQTSPVESLHVMLSSLATTVKLKAEELHTHLRAGETEAAIAIAHKLHELGDALDPDNAAVQVAIHANAEPEPGVHPDSDNQEASHGWQSGGDPTTDPLTGQAAFDAAARDKAAADAAAKAKLDPQSPEVLKGRPREDEKWSPDEHPARPIGGAADGG
jgi:hypothetical protein